MYNSDPTKQAQEVVSPRKPYYPKHPDLHFKILVVERVKPRNN